MNTPVLYIFSGLPAVGKSTIAQAVASNLAAAYLRIDTIEQGLRDLCGTEVEGEGYRLSYRIAEDNLKIGRSVVADSCNPIELTRTEWEDCALGVVLPSWQDIQAREYHPWSRDVVRIDTANRSLGDCIDELMEILT
jgi:predicted kinase